MEGQLVIFLVIHLACIFICSCELVYFFPSDLSPWLIPGSGALSEGKQLSISSGGKVISGNEILNESDQTFIESASTAGGSFTNAAEGKNIIFFIYVALFS